jgi:hypothetical protein
MGYGVDSISVWIPWLIAHGTYAEFVARVRCCLKGYHIGVKTSKSRNGVVLVFSLSRFVCGDNAFLVGPDQLDPSAWCIYELIVRSGVCVQTPDAWTVVSMDIACDFAVEGDVAEDLARLGKYLPLACKARGRVTHRGPEPLATRYLHSGADGRGKLKARIYCKSAETHARTKFSDPYEARFGRHTIRIETRLHRYDLRQIVASRSILALAGQYDAIRARADQVCNFSALKSLPENSDVVEGVRSQCGVSREQAAAIRSAIAIHTDYPRFDELPTDKRSRLRKSLSLLDTKPLLDGLTLLPLHSDDGADGNVTVKQETSTAIQTLVCRSRDALDSSHDRSPGSGSQDSREPLSAIRSEDSADAVVVGDQQPLLAEPFSPQHGRAFIAWTSNRHVRLESNPLTRVLFTPSIASAVARRIACRGPPCVCPNSRSCVAFGHSVHTFFRSLFGAEQTLTSAIRMTSDGLEIVGSFA